MRFSGGANAGHTIVLGGEQYALHLVPSAYSIPDKTVILGTGMVIDPEALFAELSGLEAKGVDWERPSPHLRPGSPRPAELPQDRPGARRGPQKAHRYDGPRVSA